MELLGLRRIKIRNKALIYCVHNFSFLSPTLRLFTCGTSNRILLLNFSSFLHQTEFNRLLNKIKLISPHKYPRKFHNKKLDSKEEVKERN